MIRVNNDHTHLECFDREIENKRKGFCLQYRGRQIKKKEIGTPLADG